MRRYWQYEENVSNKIRGMVGQVLPVMDDMASRIDQLFVNLRTPEENDKSQIHWQSVAAATAARNAFCIISGGPGTGKTTTVVQILALLQGMALEEGQGLRISLAAPTGKAAARLTTSVAKTVGLLPEEVRKKVPTEVTTLHRLLGSRIGTRRFKYNIKNKLHIDLLVVDEASMVDLEMMSAVLDALPDQARLILLGDKDQLSSVEAGSVLGDLCCNADRPGYKQETLDFFNKNTGYNLQEYAGKGADLDQQVVLLRKSHRFDKQSGIGNLAKAVKAGSKVEVMAVWQNGYTDISRIKLQSLNDPDFTHLVLQGEPNTSNKKDSVSNITGGYKTYLQTVGIGTAPFSSEDEWFEKVLHDFNKFQLLTPLRQGYWGVEGLNKRITEILVAEGLIEAKDGWYAGRPVMVNSNDYSLGLMNGDIGVALPVKKDENHNTQQKLMVIFPTADGSIKRVSPSRLKNIETVFAMTVHKSQGSEFDHTALVIPDYMSSLLTRELLYTGVTRASKKFTLVGSRMDIFVEAVQQRTYRSSGLKIKDVR